MSKKIILSVRQDHDVMKNFIEKFQKVERIELVIHDPINDYIDLEDLPNLFIFLVSAILAASSCLALTYPLSVACIP